MIQARLRLPLCALALAFMLTAALPLRATPDDTPKPTPEVQALLDQGKQAAQKYQFDQALRLYNEALEKARALKDKPGEAATLHKIGIVYYYSGQPQKALEFFQQALPLRRVVGDKAGEAWTLTGMAYTLEAQGHLAEADQRLQAAIRLLETLRESLGGLSEAKSIFLASHIETYDRAVALLLKRHNPADAFTLAQKTKARALLDLLYDGKVDLSRSLTEEERTQERELRQRANLLNRQMMAEGVRNEPGAKQRFAALKEQLEKAEGELQTFTDRLYARHPDLAHKRAARTATLNDLARFLPADTALLEYVVLQAGTGREKLDRTVLFVVTADRGRAQTTAFPLPIPPSELTERADDFREACADPTKSYRAKARDLYRLLLAPAARQLVGKKRLIVCPDGPLWGLPFAALLDGRDRFLVQSFDIAYAYSATGAQAALLARAQARHAKPTGTLLAMANPDFGDENRFGAPGTETDNRPITAPSRPLLAPSRDLYLPRGGRLTPLPGTEWEAQAIHRDFSDAKVYTGKEAQEVVVKREAGKYRYLHFATHGFFNDAAPLMSSIVLAEPAPGSEEDGFLTAREVFDLDLSADMVVLSACNTGRGEKRSGEGIVGMTWALFVAGAPTQVVSQWSVDDASTATLMERFYGGIKRGEAKGLALRAAALSLRKDGKHAHPYYWAPFILVGDWRK
jgi:CHAT domain-containing protein